LEIYYAAVEDDPLDSGGWIIEGGTCGTIKGEDGKRRRFTFLGQQAWCEQCKSAGVIVAAPGSPGKKRLYDRQSGRQQALGGDLVLCKCERHPRINPVYGRTWKITDDGGRAGSVTSTRTSDDRNGCKSPASVTLFDDQFAIRDDNGEPIMNACYSIQRASGSLEHGYTTAAGHTSRLAAADDAESIHIYVGHRA
jgi:hypothetical protein